MLGREAKALIVRRHHLNISVMSVSRLLCHRHWRHSHVISHQYHQLLTTQGHIMNAMLLPDNYLLHIPQSLLPLVTPVIVEDELW